MPHRGAGLFLAVFFWLAFRAGAEPVTLNPVADTTLIQTAPNNNLGVATFFNAGTTGTGIRNRAVMRFDLSGSIPANAIITSVQLTLTVIRQPGEFPSGSIFSLHQVLQPWGEGTKTHDGTPDQPISPGLGNLATTGDGTWNDRFFGMSAPWASPGGAPGIDFVGAASADIDMGGTGNYTFIGQPGLIADVQHWLDHPELNFGWMLMSDAESTRHTARSFASREDLFGQAPLLSIDFQPVPEPGVLAIASIGTGVVFLYFRRRRTN